MGKEVHERGPTKNCPPILPFKYLVLIRNDKINCKKKKDYKVIKISYIKYRNISYKCWIKKFSIYLVFLGHFINRKWTGRISRVGRKRRSRKRQQKLQETLNTTQHSLKKTNVQGRGKKANQDQLGNYSVFPFLLSIQPL